MTSPKRRASKETERTGMPHRIDTFGVCKQGKHHFSQVLAIRK